MKLIIKITLLVLTLSIFSCEKEYAKKEMSNIEVMNDMVLEEPMALRKPSAKNSQKIIKESYLSFETESVEQTFQYINTQVSKYKGYIQSDNVTKDYRQITREIIVRIPTNNFQPVIDSISKKVRVFDRKSISLKDVTEEFIDLEARLKVKLELEIRYLELLKKAKNVKEMLQIEREVAKIREEIEAKQGRLKYLKNQVSFSTINLTFYEPIQVVKSKSKTYFSKVLNALKGGFNSLGDLLLGFLYIWPYIIFIVITFYFIRNKFIKRKK